MHVVSFVTTLCFGIGAIIHALHTSFDRLDQLGARLAGDLAGEYDARLCAELAALRRNLQDAERVMSQTQPEASELWQRARREIEHELDIIYQDALVPDAEGICAAGVGIKTHVHYQGHDGWPRDWPNAVARYLASDRPRRLGDDASPEPRG